ncbi:hypothetical protein BvCmsKSNP120_02001 [Escherichia coli]|nr:hypothetical protein BvCmsKSNP120_02001 [Escherichia coli]
MKEGVTYQHVYTFEIYRICDGYVEEYKIFPRGYWKRVKISVRLLKKMFKRGLIQEIDF